MHNIAANRQLAPLATKPPLGGWLLQRFDPGQWLSAPGRHQRLIRPLSLAEEGDAVGFEL